MSELLYLYAVLPADSPAARWLRRQPPPGIDGRATVAVEEGGLVGVAGPVSAADFDAEPLNRQVSDLEWLGPRAAAHQRVNQALFERGEALLPLAFGTVFRDASGVRRLLAERADDLRARLKAVRGRGEWVLTLQRDDPLALAALDQDDGPLAPLQAEIAAAGPGRAFLLKRRLDDARRQALLELDAQARTALLDAAEALAEHAVREPLAAGALLLRLSLLVPREREQALEPALAALGRAWEPRGYRLRLTGPWPAYRFGSLAGEAVGGAV